MNLNYFKYVEIIRAGSPETLALKFQAINLAFQVVQIWTDGKEHFAMINAQKRLSASLKARLAEIK